MREKARSLEVLDTLWTPEDVTEDGGVVKVIVEQEEDNMHPAVGDTVHFHYTITIEESGLEVFNSRDNNGQERKLLIGDEMTNKCDGVWGLDLGLRQTKLGQVVRLTCKPEYAFGRIGRKELGVPRSAVVIFEAELKTLWDFGETVIEEVDGAVYKSLQKAGKGLEHPRIGGLGDKISMVTVFMSAYCNGRSFLRDEISWNLGDAHTQNLPDGLDFALERMLEEERSIIKCTGKWAYGEAGNEKYSIPPNADVIFNVNLKQNGFVCQTYFTSIQSKIGEAIKWKASGTRFLKENKPYLALNKFREIVDLLEVIGKDFRKEQARLSEAKEKRKEMDKRRRERQALIDVMGDDYNSDWEAEEEGESTSVFYAHKELRAKVARGEIDDPLNTPRPGQKGFCEDWGEWQQARDDLYRTSHMNAALCCIKAREGFAAVRHCKRALELEPNNVKLLYRMAQAYRIQGYYRKAVEYYKQVIAIEPNNKAAKLCVKQCSEEAKSTMEKQKRTFSKMIPKSEPKEKSFSTVHYDSDDDDYYC